MRVLVHYDKPELFLDLLSDRFPSVEVECCRSYAELPSAMAAFQPQSWALLSAKKSRSST